MTEARTAAAQQADSDRRTGRPVQPGRLERAISAVSPRWASRRAEHRARAQAWRNYGEALTGYSRHSRLGQGVDSARADRLRGHWGGFIGASADREISTDLPAIRAKSRDLSRNNPYGAGALDSLVVNFVGMGVRPQSRIDHEAIGISEDVAARFQNQAEAAWLRWNRVADAANRLTFDRLQWQAFRGVLEAGDIGALAVGVEEPGRPFSLACQLVEADRIATPDGYRSNSNVRDGVVVGARLEPLGFYVRTTYPGGDTAHQAYRSGEYQLVPPRHGTSPGLVFLCDQKRPGQTRGLPIFTPALNYFCDLADYMEAELVAARVAACFALVIRGSVNPTTQAASASAGLTDGTGAAVQELSPGIIAYTGGETIESFSPNRPPTTFQSFIETILRAIARSLNLPYELLSSDWSRSNYSNLRGAMMQAYRFFLTSQDWLATTFCQPFYELCLEESIIRGYVDAPGWEEYRELYCSADWLPRQGQQWVDPETEAKATEIALRLGIQTLADICGSQGKDWEAQLRQRRRELDLCEELDLPTGLEVLPRPAQAIAQAAGGAGNG